MNERTEAQMCKHGKGYPTSISARKSLAGHISLGTRKTFRVKRCDACKKWFWEER